MPRLHEAAQVLSYKTTCNYMCKANFKTWVIIESVSHSGGYSTAFIYNIKISTKYKEQNFSSYFACRGVVRGDGGSPFCVEMEGVA